LEAARAELAAMDQITEDVVDVKSRNSIDTSIGVVVDHNSTYEVANGIERCDVISFPIPKARGLMALPMSMMCPFP
jgi:hypothetical protein